MYKIAHMYIVRLANQSWKDNQLIISPAIVIDNRLVITEDLVIILPVWAWLLPYVILYCMYSVRQAWANSVDLDEMLQMRHLIRVYTVCHSSQQWVVNCTCSNFRAEVKYGKATEIIIK